VTNDDDDGPGSLRYVIDCVEDGDTVTFHSSLHGATISLLSIITIDKSIYIHSDLTAPRIMISSTADGAFIVSADESVEMKNIEITSGEGGAGSQGAGIENYGLLTLWDVCVFKNVALPSDEYMIYNATGAQITLKGTCHFEE
jgi:hypothetical protein